MNQCPTLAHRKHLACKCGCQALQSAARQDDAELGRNDMSDTLIGVMDIEQLNPRCMACGAGFGDESITAGHHRFVTASGSRIYDMIHHRKDARRIDHRAVSACHAIQRRSACPFVQKNPVDGDQCGATTQIDDDMGIPDFSKRVFALTSLPLQRTPIARYELLLNRSAGLQNAVPDPVPGSATVNAAVGQLDHLIQIKRWIASALPIQHHRAVKFIERHFGCPALNQIIVPPDAPIAILSRKLADFGAAVVPQIVVGLVIRIGSIVGKATDQAALCSSVFSFWSLK